MLLFAFGWFATVLTPVAAEEPAAEQPEAAEAEEADAETDDADEKADKKPDGKEEPDPLALPKDASTKDLVEFITKVMNMRPEGATREEMIENYVKAQRALSEAASLILADKEAKDDAQLAIQIKIRALQALEQLADEDLAAEKKKLVELYKDDERPGVGEIIEFVKVWMELDAAFADGADTKKAAAALIEAIAADGGKNMQLAQLFTDYASTLEDMEAYAEATDVYKQLQEVWSKSDNPRIKMAAKQFEGTIHRLSLFGKTIELDGKLLDGTEVDWKEYRGKYVLVDFWATWCGPCIQELPNVLENYKKYHDQGFDVLGISLDGSRSPEPKAIEENKKSVAEFMEGRELPWKTMYSDDPEATGWKHPMATRFGISGIPFAMLVDPEGKVISFSARGENLSELLEKHLGDDKAKDAKETKDGSADAGS
jgi:thiol-disulfide isomerase/thioredoxin